MAESISTVFDTMRGVIESRIQAQWQTAGELTTPIQFPGVQGLKSNLAGAMIDKPPTNTPWLRVDLPGGFINPATIGPTALNNHTGVLLLTVYAPRNHGTRQIEQLAGRAAQIFNGFSGSGIRETVVESAVFVPTIPQEAGWLKKAVQVRFYYWSNRAAA